MKTTCSTEGHYFYRTLNTVAHKCTYCTARRWPWSRESVASLRAVAVLRLASKNPAFAAKLLKAN